jgi:hypothetical protein
VIGLRRSHHSNFERSWDGLDELRYGASVKTRRQNVDGERYGDR